MKKRWLSKNARAFTNIRFSSISDYRKHIIEAHHKKQQQQQQQLHRTIDESLTVAESVNATMTSISSSSSSSNDPLILKSRGEEPARKARMERMAQLAEE